MRQVYDLLKIMKKDTPPDGLTQDQFEWFIQHLTEEGTLLNHGVILELLLSIDEMNDNTSQGKVLKEWIKRESSPREALLIQFNQQLSNEPQDVQTESCPATHKAQRLR